MFASKDVFLKSSGGGYTIARSVRFRQSASAYLNRTPSVASNRRTFTWSGWVKLGILTTSETIFSTGATNTAGTFFGIQIYNTGKINIGNGATDLLRTTPLYRDPSAWYHVVVAVDTTNATANNRVRLYINGVEVTAFDTRNNPTQNTDFGVNNTIVHYLGTSQYSGTRAEFFDGYMTEVNLIDGQALTPSSFGETDAIIGAWKPKQYTGTYGTNGFYLKFNSYATAAALGTDSSGNSNTWTVNNLSVTAGTTYDSMLDVPTLTNAAAANYPTWNPLWQGRTNTPTNGNLDYPASSIGIGTMALSGSSYWEITSTGGTSTVALYSTTASTSQTVTTGLTYGFRFNATTGAFDYTTNGSSFTSIATGLTSGPYFFYVSTAASTTASLNAGQQGFTYTPPSGFVALNTYNLSTPTIANGAAQMAATLYTGTLVSNAISNAVNSVSFQPDWVWIKSRSAATDNKLTDVLRGVTKGLVSNSTAVETTDTQGLTAFSSGGFTVGTNTDYNNLAATYVAWQWKANGTGVSNTSGSITSTVSANTTAGFSIVTYTGTGANATVGHGLGVAPVMVIVKCRSNATNWTVGSSYLTSWAYFLQLSSTVGQTLAAAEFNSTAPTSSVFSVGTDTDTNGSARTYVAYVFAAVAGYSAFGSYTGNGSTDGPFVYLGFRPRWVMIKRTDSTSDWYMWDTSRDTYNVVTATLLANTAGAETSATSIDDLSNGFKCRSATVVNVSSGTYIYAAFAENPFKYSLAR